MIGYQEVLDIWEEVNKEDFPETQQGNFDMAGMSEGPSLRSWAPMKP